ncbi:(2Fe-2S) ferredoxin domain-containing protein [Bradyrhizobium sp. ISRA443]|uniref:(2Fe-2S) ferredoxin domain-containing protein n=1 Tax=unclassified Bradyrhizobium TaxID=2631580 RepID=UPI00247B1ED9|nr:MULTISPECIES: (2Fe-2S) ferredoxin domain-containing protein [unclassified Bradyrhizobium]WGR96265.1 (2Fe-2S) ferredoxin domain-containing protein [Bradyrhizobium sp. ISRA435]WGR98145.1 (2Fe-2S) ferredoxin domain-containing protein [Bradyrhizobium sp. ISRA436]WGS05034.1 (2Fe-2S) ferredoxin domain-containing protein [Bradyrhizobium sp. ISRA437]WGS11919.1 (2Fe-2S) ferredoxin domain-containing protein [Bradyrhizobium sp. ISRA443]
MNAETKFELPQLYRHHVFACHTERPPTHPHGSCVTSGGQALWDRMVKSIETQGLTDIGFTATSCLGFCSAGPLMVVYPDGIWYRATTPEDIDEIVESHLKRGHRVDRLVMALKR